MTLFPGARARARGVVLAHGRRIGLVWLTAEAATTLLPINAPAATRRRSDVPIDALAELQAMGFGVAERWVRAGRPYSLAHGASTMILGRAPTSLMERIALALLREAHARRIEESDRPRPEREQPVRL